MEIRKKNNNSLTGKPVNEILTESEEYFSRSQRIRMFFFFVSICLIMSYAIYVNIYGDDRESEFSNPI